MFCAIALNAFFLLYHSDERFGAGDEHIESAFKLPPHTTTHVATSDFQAELLSKLLFTGTHLRKRAVAMLSYSFASMLLTGTHLRKQVVATLLYSFASTLHPQVT